MPYADRERQLEYQREYMKEIRARQPKRPPRKHPFTRDLPEIQPLDLAWLAGLLEGEGWFGWGKRANTHGTGRFFYRVPAIQVVMTDEDVVRRVGTLTNTAVTGPHGLKRSGTLPTFRCGINGHKAMTLMGMLRPLMGARRSQTIGEILAIGVKRVLKAA